MAKTKRFEIVDPATEQPYIRMFIYGPSGAGKTTLAASAAFVPEMQNVLLIDPADSSDSVVGEGYEHMTVVKLGQYEAINDIYNWLHPKGEDALKELGFNTIIIDELDTLHMMIVNWLVRRSARENPNRDDWDIYLEDWGDARTLTHRILERFRQLPAHFIVNSLVDIREDNIDGREYRVPNLAGKLRDEVPARFAIHTYLDVDIPRRRPNDPNVDTTGTRLAHFTATRKFRAKVRGLSRAERFGDQMEDPTMSKIYNMFMNKE